MNQTCPNAASNARSDSGPDRTLWDSVDRVGIRLLNEMTSISLTPEDLYSHTIRMLESLCAISEHTDSELDNLWYHLYNDIRKATPASNPMEARLTSAIVVGFVALTVYSSQHDLYRIQLSRQLISCLGRQMHKDDRWEQKLEVIFDAELPEGWFDQWRKGCREDQQGSDQVQVLPGLQKKLPPGSTVNIYNIDVNNGGQYQPVFQEGSTNYQHNTQYNGK